MTGKVLIVEDEVIVAMDIAKYVKSIGLEVVGMAADGEKAYHLATTLHPDVVLMDINIKGDKDGIEIAQQIREELPVSLIYITAYIDDETIARAVTTNPAAYLAKPFHKQELNATLQIATKRKRRRNDDATLLRGDIILDDEFSFESASSQLICCGAYVHLTKREQQLLKLLITSKNQIVSFYVMENSIWPDKSANENTRRALVSRLRTKLKHQFIETISAQGYRLSRS